MKFDSTDCANTVSGVAAGALAVGMLGVPKMVNDMMMADKVPSPMFHHASLMAGTIAAMNAISLDADDKTKKTMCKINGIGWAACAGAHTYNITVKKDQKRDASIGMAAGAAAIAAINLWQGFKKD